MRVTVPVTTIIQTWGDGWHWSVALIFNTFTGRAFSYKTFLSSKDFGFFRKSEGGEGVAQIALSPNLAGGGAALAGRDGEGGGGSAAVGERPVVRVQRGRVVQGARRGVRLAGGGAHRGPDGESQISRCKEF